MKTDARVEDEADEDEADEADASLEEEEVVEVKQAYPKVYHKAKQTKSKGVEDIHQLPLDWFSKVRQTYKQNQIIPRQKDKGKQ